MTGASLHEEGEGGGSLLHAAAAAGDAEACAFLLRHGLPAGQVDMMIGGMGVLLTVTTARLAGAGGQGRGV